MKPTQSRRDEHALRPIGAAFAAVVAGLGPAQADAVVEARAYAPLEPAAQANTYVLDPTNHPGFEEDPAMILGPSEPAAPLVETAAPKPRQDLFEL